MNFQKNRFSHFILATDRKLNLLAEKLNYRVVEMELRRKKVYKFTALIEFRIKFRWLKKMSIFLMIIGGVPAAQRISRNENKKNAMK